MKTFNLFLSVALLSACQMLDGEPEAGELRVSFAGVPDEVTRVMSEIPDTGDFIITIDDAKGRNFYEGPYGACPEVMSVPSGSYVIKVISREFDKPEFSAPQYGDEQCVIIPSGGVADVKLLCTQINAGVRLKVDSDFLTVCPDGVLFLKSSKGKLMYGYSEKRTAYFTPGVVSLVLSGDGKEKVLMTRTLLAQDMLTIGVRAPALASGVSGPAAALSVSVDTTRNWSSESVTVGEDADKGGAASTAMTVAQAIESAGEEDVWVGGYIVGGDLTSSAASFAPPFKSRTNIVLGPKSSTTLKTSCLSIQLPAGELRDELNLVDNPSLLGKKLYIRGDIVDSYYGIPGMKNVVEYEIR